jgi:hypothetical protein
MALVCAAKFASSVESEIAHGRLEAEGVENFVFDLGLGSMGIPLAVRLMVDEDDFALAKRALAGSRP